MGQWYGRSKFGFYACYFYEKKGGGEKKSNEKAWKNFFYNTTKLDQPSPNIAAFMHRDATGENFMNYMHSKTNQPKQAKSKLCAARLFS